MPNVRRADASRTNSGVDSRRARVADVVRAVIDSNGGQATPLQVEAVCDAAGYGEAEVRRAFTTLGLVATTNPKGRVVWVRQRRS